MANMAGPDPGPLFAMWAVMMAAMMLPGALPLVAARGAFSVAGYLVVWTAFSVAAALAHWGLSRSGALSASMTLQSLSVAALVVAGVGVYQLTPLKRAFLSRCRAQCAVRVATTGGGGWGAVYDGMRYGLSCLACCWALMALLFVTGVMNVVAMAALAVFVLVEKIVPRGIAIDRIAGVALLACGVVMQLRVVS